MGVIGSIQGWWRSRRSASGRANAQLAPHVRTAEWDMSRGLDVQQLGVLATAPVSMLPSERLLLYALVYGARPQRYLEVGTLYGGSAAIVCAALDTLELTTRMALVDPEPRVDAQLLAHLERRATLVRGYSPAAIKDAAAGGSFDFILIDGDHTYQGTLNDLDGVLPYCLAGAYIVCHDCFYPTVEQAIDDFVLKHTPLIADFGPLTRDTSSAADADGNVSAQHAARWGGLRVLQVRMKP
jgi:predicted O-methyltransferase YrrM